MSRPLRIEFPGAIDHVTSRGDRREAIFEDVRDWGVRSLKLTTRLNLGLKLLNARQSRSQVFNVKPVSTLIRWISFTPKSGSRCQDPPVHTILS